MQSVTRSESKTSASDGGGNLVNEIHSKSSESNSNSRVNYNLRKSSHSSLSKPVHYITDDTKEGKAHTESAVPTSIRQFYAGRSIFLTGGTGFLGKFLVYRLLTTSPQLNKIYVLLRGKRGKNFTERADQYLASDLFTHLSANDDERKTLLSKIVLVQGDVTHELLGLSQDDLANICQNVSIIFHSAACIRFNEPLKSACKIHIQGTKEVLNVAKKINKMTALIHVSSISTYFREDVTTESIRDGPYEPEEFSLMIDEMTEQQVDQMTPSLLAGYPNSYTLTKTLAEILVRNSAGSVSFPVLVSRPPFIWPSYITPYCGYFEVPQTMASLTTLFSCGIVRTTRLDPQVISQYMPVDMVCNSLIASAWYIASRPNDKQVKVINMSPIENSVSVQEFSSYANEAGLNYPSIHQLRPPYGVIKRQHSPIEYSLRKVFSHLLFAYLIDLMLTLNGGKSKLVKLTHKIHEQMSVAVDAFGKQTINVEMKNLFSLQEAVRDEEERELFNFDFNCIDWRKLVIDHHLQFRRFTLKESDDNLPAARDRLRKITISYTLIKMVASFFFLWLALTSFQMIIQVLVK